MRIIKGIRTLVALAVSMLAAPAVDAYSRGITVCDPPDFRLEAGESYMVPVDTAVGRIRVGLAVEFPRQALRSLGSAVTLTFMRADSVPAYEAVLSIAEDPSLAGFEERALRLAVDSISPCGERIPLLDHYASKNVNISGGLNCLIAEFADGKALFFVGSDKMVEAGTAECSAGFGVIRLGVNRGMDVRRMEVTMEENFPKKLMTGWTEESLASHFASSTDPVEGFWRFLDRDNDPEWAIPGGYYDLAVVKNADGAAYDIIYIGGAEVAAINWRPGMLKGSLAPTIFADHYKLTWTDSRFLSDYSEATADLSLSNTVLTLNFPLYRSQLRFSRRQPSIP